MNYIWNYFFPPPPPPKEYKDPWRPVDWRDSKQNLLRTLNNFQSRSSEVESLRFLLHGPVGAGKSSFINSVDSCLQGRVTTRALANSKDSESNSFTLKCKTYKLMKDTRGSFYPFTFTDIMGITPKHGVQTEDIIKILGGHIRDDYTFNPVKPISEDDPKFIRNPSLKDKIHCLVSVLPADTGLLIPKDFIRQMSSVRETARDLDIPQVVIMTRIDKGCPLVKGNLQKVYTSIKIKEKMEECSVRLGVPVSYIYPVKNYHEEDNTNTDTDVLVLHALQNIVNFANDYVMDKADTE